MRRVLMPRPGRSRGVSMIEVVVVLAITAAGVGMAVPYYKDYSVNARLREAGMALLSEAMAAQSEAIKRNGPVRLVVSGAVSANSGSVITVVDSANPGTPLRTRALGHSLYGTNTTITFGGSGALAPLGAAVPGLVEVSMDNITCTTDLRCPALVVQIGGGMKFCKDKNSC
jgi:type IV fimbrial biogenesis protein FimT